MRTKKPFLWLSLLLVFGLVAAACGGDDSDDSDDAGTDDTSAEDSADCPDVEGDVIVSGSSTVQPISSRVGELLEDCGSGVAANVDGPGTGDGFQLFCDGETDISDASRPINEEEVAACEDAGIEFIELKVGIDGISVLTNPANEIECLSFADLYALVGPESEGFENWSDAQDLATELGSATDLPRRTARHHRPGRGVRHLRRLPRDRARRHQRGPRRGRRDHRGAGRDGPQGLLVAGRRQRHHRRHRGLGLQPRLGRLRLRRAGGRRCHRDPDLGRARRRVRRARRRDHRRAASTRSPATSTST